MDSGEPIVQWRKVYFSKFGVSCPENLIFMSFNVADAFEIIFLLFLSKIIFVASNWFACMDLTTSYAV